MNSNAEWTEEPTAATPGNAELENTLVSLLFVLMTAFLFLLIGTAETRERIDASSGEVVDAEVVHRSGDRQSADS